MVSTPHSYGAFLTRSGLRGTTSDETTIGRRPKSVATTAAMAIGPKDVTIARCSPVLRASSVYPAPESRGKTRSPAENARASAELEQYSAHYADVRQSRKTLKRSRARPAPIATHERGSSAT